MLFSSIPFLYYFLPVVLLLYYLAPYKLKNTVILISSLAFYAFGEPRFVLIMILNILLGYIFGILIEAFHQRKWDKLFLGLSLCTSLGMLGYFKYADFFILNFNRLTGLGIPLLRIALPVGISFYTFQLLSYTIDVYRGRGKAQKNFILLATYIASFPQLIAGPIVRYADIEPQLTKRVYSIDKLALGIRRFVLGLSKKVLLANSLGELCEIFKASKDLSILFFWLYAVSFTLHIYFDFSGYSDMAIGLGKMLGFDFPENFNYPYISSSITQFWRRWHISLGSWFRDYLYIPLGGNRVSSSKWLFNIFLVWFATGLWHGASWNFILWGLLYGLLLVIEKQGLYRLLERSKIGSHIYVMLFVTLGFVLFNAADLKEAATDLGAMFGLKGYPLFSAEFWYYLRSYSVTLIISALAATPLFSKLVASLNNRKYGTLLTKIAEPVLLVALLLVNTAYLVDGSFNPFLYFRF
ncbi:MAG: MBOAT family O-acyltransferase [Lachnospiraceae bacterium]|nr:MBOAT family O-acyltransferase [Lachnospiraceae bacterium]